MAVRTGDLLKTLSTTDLKRLLAARERIDVLERERDELLAAVAKVDQELAKLVAGAPRAGERRRRGRPKSRLSRQGPTGKAKRKSAASVKKTPVKTSGQSARAQGRVKLEDVIVAVIKRHGGPLPYRDIFAKVVTGKLFKTKSNNFDNVMRRTLSTSTLVKRVGRGVYDLA